MRVGVLGAGQLGRMIGLAGIPLGLEFRYFDPANEAPADATGDVFCGKYDDQAALRKFAAGLDVLTYEFENVPAASLDLLADLVEIRPGRLALEKSQDRVTEKTFFEQCGVPTGEWMAANSAEDIRAAWDKFGPSVVKTRRFGYDGKGQFRLNRPEDCEAAWRELDGQGLIVEKLVPFDRELSLVGVRSLGGDMRTYPLVENVHRGGILHKTTAPAAKVSDETRQRAEEFLCSLMEALNYVGVLTIELFDVGGQLFANEMAPRVHNSGHWTIEGAVTSQFENHVRAIAGLPLGATQVRVPSIMLNCIGSMPARERVLEVEGAHLHNYGKTPREGRKVGHITICDEPQGGDALADKADQLEPLIQNARENV